MQEIYTPELCPTQDLPDRYFDTVNIDDEPDLLPEHDILSDEAARFLSKFPANWSFDTIKRTIIIGWRKKLYPANDAINWLVICGFIKPALRANLDLWMENYAIHEIGTDGLPEPFAPVDRGAM